MISVPVAYEWADMTFCPSCALNSTALGMMIAQLPRPADMDEAIATIMLAQIERGLEIATPIGTVTPSVDKCQACDKALIPNAERESA